MSSPKMSCVVSVVLFIVKVVINKLKIKTHSSTYNIYEGGNEQVKKYTNLTCILNKQYSITG